MFHTCGYYCCQEELSYTTKTEQLDLLQKVLAATDADAEEEQMIGVDWSTKKHKVQQHHCWCQHRFMQRIDVKPLMRCMRWHEVNINVLMLSECVLGQLHDRTSSLAKIVIM